ERLIARDHPGVAPGGRTIAYVHSECRERSVVLLHGMSASPAQFERIARELYERGHNVVVPRLPHHGHVDPLSTAMERLRAEELYEAATEYLAVARELGERVTFAGFSLGGLLTAWIAQHHDVDRAVPIAPFFGVSWIPHRLMGPIAERLLRVPNRFHWWNPILRERQFLATNGYPRYATHAIGHCHRIARGVLEDAQDAAPSAEHVMIVVNAMEVAVSNYAIRRLYESWRRRRPSNVEVKTLTGLPLSHDIVSPMRRWRLADRVHPHLLRAIDPVRPASDFNYSYAASATGSPAAP
ncbi:MAG: alpha/beta hydrolase, partial [Candidatus Eremiobacteraeota bacterium]|nr:alpha/beta hydrolase [Candidatus Eremiobacteraeota bacterium]